MCSPCAPPLCTPRRGRVVTHPRSTFARELMTGSGARFHRHSRGAPAFKNLFGLGWAFTRRMRAPGAARFGILGALFPKPPVGSGIFLGNPGAHMMLLFGILGAQRRHSRGFPPSSAEFIPESAAQAKGVIMTMGKGEVGKTPVAAA